MGNFKNMYEKLCKDVREEFNNSCRAIFDRFPTLKSFTFFQYTPGFNDGDPCYNSLCIDSYELTLQFVDGYISGNDESDQDERNDAIELMAKQIKSLLQKNLGK